MAASSRAHLPDDQALVRRLRSLGTPLLVSAVVQWARGRSTPRLEAVRLVQTLAAAGAVVLTPDPAAGGELAVSLPPSAPRA